MVGGGGPIVIQSMTTTTPEDLEGSLAQIGALQAAGCQIVRLAVPSIEAARALAPLREAMRARALDVPLCADVHFNPRAAYEAARHVEKVRINPGNFAPTPEEARQRLAPLIDLARERGIALRIGVNHGSLAPHVAAAYGHGPRGMVASAIEYLRFCRDAGFEQLVVALKASNPAIMVAANRLLVETLRAEGMDYPIHLGVTEAGAGQEGVLRSALGIGALLLEGIGDTIRVSLTGDPVPEIEACRRILRAVEAESAASSTQLAPATARASVLSRWGKLTVGATRPPCVELVLRLRPHKNGERTAAWEGLERTLGLAAPESPAESILLMDPEAPRRADVWADAVLELRARLAAREAPPAVWLSWPAGELARLPAEIATTVDGLHLLVDAAIPPPRIARGLEALARARPDLALRWHLAATASVALASALVEATRAAGLPAPALTWSGPDLAAVGRTLAERVVAGPGADASLRPVLVGWMPADPVHAAIAFGPLLLDGGIDALIVDGPDPQPAYDLLQLTRRRLLRADFISCPGCGRLAYDLEGAVRSLKAKFGHLAGVKIAVMGCAVNGPGEMADADVGYVGSAAGKVDVYAGRERVGRALDPVQAEALLVALLQARGLWREPPASR